MTNSKSATLRQLDILFKDILFLTIAKILTRRILQEL